MTQMQMDRVRFVGIDKLHLDAYTSNELQRVVARGVDHLRERAGDLIDVTVRLKAHRLPGTDERYAALIEMSYSAGWISGIADDWDLLSAVKRAFGKLMLQIEQASLLD